MNFRNYKHDAVFVLESVTFVASFLATMLALMVKFM